MNIPSLILMDGCSSSIPNVLMLRDVFLSGVSHALIQYAWADIDHYSSNIAHFVSKS